MSDAPTPDDPTPAMPLLAVRWDAPSVRPCAPSSLGGYPAERTRAYGNASARAVVLLVETSDAKVRESFQTSRCGERSGAAASVTRRWRHVRSRLVSLDTPRLHPDPTPRTGLSPPAWTGSSRARTRRATRHAYARRRLRWARAAQRAPRASDARPDAPARGDATDAGTGTAFVYLPWVLSLPRDCLVSH